MSKSGSEHWETSAVFGEPIPTYEESLAISPGGATILVPSEKPNSSVSSLFRQGRNRRVLDLISDTILPAISVDLANGCSHIPLVIVPSETLGSSSKLDERNIVTPGRQTYEASRTVVVLQGQDKRPSFWTQNAVVQELDLLLRKELGCSSRTSNEEPLPRELSTSGFPSQSPLQLQAEPTPANAELPPRPKKKLWLKRDSAVTEAESDPTGETGKWNLGWRGPETPGGRDTKSGDHDVLRHRTRVQNLKVDEVALHTRLQDVSIRTEDQMGLFRTTTVKCIWIEIDVGT
ncbi:hypothetical protein EDD37DRAFT_453862 [Exophiala viscosa]|uniref:uncharacterized protein n=1 Tax=Exophiala viscosa TaxID=2486360 RepID=UPI00219EF6BD|nr:hypothetical protein EDD37DRAFT_453862 [Exophiala viscosa]